MSLHALKLDCQIQQKKGMHFILASVVIWSAICIIQWSSLDQLTKNLLTFCSTAPLVPLAFVFSKLLNINFQHKENPLTTLGIVLSLTQVLYLLIAMWIYPTIPDKMVMVIAMIFGAHLLPFGWLYDSKSYYIFSVVITILAFIVGLLFQPSILALLMIVMEILFSAFLFQEVRKLPKMVKG